MDKSASLELCARADEIHDERTHTNIQNILDITLVLALNAILTYPINRGVADTLAACGLSFGSKCRLIACDEQAM